MEKYKQWDIWLARIKFEDAPQTKVRPVLILGSNIFVILASKITSQGKHLNSYAIKDWAEAGLAKPTFIRVDKYLELVDSDFVRKIGRLSCSDIQSLSKYYLK